MQIQSVFSRPIIKLTCTFGKERIPVIPVFSLAYLRHVGPASLQYRVQYRVSFDVGIRIIHVL